MISVRFLPIKKYCETFGDTVGAVNKRLSRGIWASGVHVFRVDGIRERQIDLKEIDKWKEKEKQKCR